MEIGILGAGNVAVAVGQDGLAAVVLGRAHSSGWATTLPDQLRHSAMGFSPNLLVTIV